MTFVTYVCGDCGEEVQGDYCKYCESEGFFEDDLDDDFDDLYDD